MYSLLTRYSAAVIHYKPEKGSCSIIDPTKIYLCDSGAQYLDGTTDTTRTFHFGTPTDKERQANTLVLKGNIALDRAIFPKGTTGFALDCLARQFLWVRVVFFSNFSCANSILTERGAGLSSRHGTRCRVVSQCTRGTYWYRNAEGLRRCVHDCRQRNIHRARLLRGW